ncbi:MAG: sensor domain-containing diguanylate cyclase [Candidatus Hatepunaea meridiana]|nr:sensor domain-containing diguanylate cyclase [Candidatus Hatepunaea meridiana]
MPDQQKSSDALIHLNADNLKTSGFTQNSLIRLVEVIMARAGENDTDVQMLLHIPSSLSKALTDRLHLDEKPRSKFLYSYNPVSEESNRRALKPFGTLTSHHLTRNDLVLILVGNSICASVSAHQQHNNNKSRQTIWNVSLSFVADEVLSGIKRFELTISKGLNDSKSALNWLDNAESKILAFERTNNLSPSWSNYLPDFIFNLERRRLTHERELKWFQLISCVQDAVGWELDTGHFFTAISQVMKNTIGFQYLEIQILESRGKKYDISNVHHRNDTAFGGKLLTVIMRPKRREVILNKHKPILIDNNSAQDFLMNPRLMDYMNLHSGILVPLVYQKRSNGLLKMFASKENHFTEEDLPGMEAIGRILARSIENVKIHTLMRRMATIDGLTNLFNRRFFNDQLMREFKRSQRYDSSLTLIMCDIDFFKHYNDNFGHLRGDTVLITVAQLLKTCVREVDFVSRYGGEEFAVILPEANLEHGILVAEKIRSVVEAHPFKYENRQPGGKLTISLGVATNTSDVDTINELINRADVALYRSKKTGRNRCETFE